MGTTRSLPVPRLRCLCIESSVKRQYVLNTYHLGPPKSYPPPFLFRDSICQIRNAGFRIVMWPLLLRLTRTNQWKCCETGSTAFRPYPRRLESLTICRCHYKGSTFWVLVRPGFEPATSRQTGAQPNDSQWGEPTLGHGTFHVIV